MVVVVVHFGFHAFASKDCKAHKKTIAKQFLSEIHLLYSDRKSGRKDCIHTTVSPSTQFPSPFFLLHQTEITLLKVATRK
jgi:hypothetical protein